MDVLSDLLWFFGPLGGDDDDDNGGSSATPPPPIVRLGASRTTAMQDLTARSKLGIGQSRSRSRHVNPVGSTPAGSSTTPGIEKRQQATVAPAAPEEEIFPAGRYAYMDLILISEGPTGPDNPFYSLLKSEYARRIN